MYIVRLKTPTLYFKTVYSVTFNKVNKVFFCMYIFLLIHIILVCFKNLIYVFYDFGDLCPVFQDHQYNYMNTDLKYICVLYE